MVFQDFKENRLWSFTKHLPNIKDPLRSDKSMSMDGDHFTHNLG